MSEAKEYAARNRQGSDWFSHSGGSAPPTHQAAATSPTQTAVTPSPKPTETPAHTDPGDSAPATGRVQMIKPASDSNQWYKYDNAADASSSHDQSKRKPAPASVTAGKSGEWYAHEAKADAKTDVKSEPVKEMDCNSRRNKQGTSSDWFTHDHVDTQSPREARVTTKEGGENASRMRGESENWYSYDAKKTQTADPVHMSKGRTTRPPNTEMHDIFHSAASQ